MQAKDYERILMELRDIIETVNEETEKAYAIEDEEEEEEGHPFVSRYNFEYFNTEGEFVTGRYKEPIDGVWSSPTEFDDLRSRQTIFDICGAISARNTNGKNLFLAGGAMLYLTRATDEFPRDLDIYDMSGVEKIISSRNPTGTIDTYNWVTEGNFEIGKYKNCSFMHLKNFNKKFIDNSSIRRIDRFALAINGIRTKLEIQIIIMEGYFAKLKRTPKTLNFDLDICGIEWKIDEKFEEYMKNQQRLIEKARARHATFKPEVWAVRYRLNGGIFLLPGKIKRLLKYMKKGYVIDWLEEGIERMTEEIALSYKQYNQKIDFWNFPRYKVVDDRDFYKEFEHIKQAYIISLRRSNVDENSYSQLPLPDEYIRELEYNRQIAPK